MLCSFRYSLLSALLATFWIAVGLTVARLFYWPELRQSEAIRLAWPIAGACFGAGLGALKQQTSRGALLGICIALALAVIIPPVYEIRE